MSFKPSNHRRRMKRRRAKQRSFAQPKPQDAAGIIAALAEPIKVAWDAALAETKS
jgi:hypothetical protein